MAVSSTGSSTTSKYDLSTLTSTWQSIVTQEMTTEKAQRLDILTKQSDAIDTRKSIYTDLSTQLTDLKSSLGALWSTSASFSSSSNRSATVGSKVVTSSGDSASTSTVFTATASSTAALGSYTIAVDHIATAHRVSSTTAYTSSSTELGISGGFTIKVGSDAKGSHFSVSSSDTLTSIAAKINSAKYADGKGISASVVNNTLVIEAANTGSDSKLSFADDASGGPLQTMGIIDGSNTIQKQLQDGVNASFSVNGIPVSRSSNKDLTDVISGVTLNLAADAGGKTATLEVTSSAAALKSALNSFITKFNSLQTYLAAKTGFTKVDEKTYTGGSLSDDFAIRSLKNDLLNQISADKGSYAVKNFAQMGITIGDNGSLSISDTTKLEAAIKDNSADVQSFLDLKMSTMDSTLGSYVGSSSSFVTYSLSSMDEQKSQLAMQIDNENERLTARQEALVAYYQNIQDTLYQLTNQQKTNSSWLYAMYGSSYSTNS